MILPALLPTQRALPTQHPNLGKIPGLRAPKPGTRIPRLQVQGKIAWLPSVAQYKDSDPAFAPETAALNLDKGLFASNSAYKTIPADEFAAALKAVGAKKMDSGGYDVASAFPAAKKVGADYMGELIITSVNHTMVAGKPRIQTQALLFFIGTDGYLYSLTETLTGTYYPASGTGTVKEAAYALGATDFRTWFVKHTKK